MAYSTIVFPYPTPMSALVDELEQDFIDLPKMLAETDSRLIGEKRKSGELKNILTLRKDNLVCWRAESSSTVFDKQVFEIVPVHPGDEVLEIPHGDNVIYLFMEDFDFFSMSYMDGYKLSRGEGYIEVHTKGRSDNTMTLFSLCLSLSYRFGTQFKFWDMYEVDNGNKQYIITLDKTCSIRGEIFKTLERHEKDILRNYRECSLSSFSVRPDRPEFIVPDVKVPDPLEEDFD